MFPQRIVTQGLRPNGMRQLEPIQFMIAGLEAFQIPKWALYIIQQQK